MSLWPSLRRNAEVAQVERKDAVSRRHSASSSYVWSGTPYQAPLGDLDIDRAVEDAWKRVGWAYRAIDARAKNASRLTVRVNNGRGIEADEIEDHPLSILLNRQANRYESGQAFRYRLHCLMDLSTKGVFVEVVTNRRGDPTELHLLHPKHTWAVPNPDRFVEGFQMRMPDGEVFDLPVYEQGKGGVLWIKRPHPTDPYMSSSWLEAAGISIDIDHYARVYNRNFLLNDGRPGGIVVIKDEDGIDPADASVLQQRMSGGPGSAGRVTILEADQADYLDTSTTPRDGQYVEARALSKQEILAFAGTPESLWNASGRTYDNADAELEGFWRNEMQPEAELVASYWEQITPGGIANDDEVVTYAWEEIEVLNRDKNEREKGIEDRARSEFEAGLITADEYRTATGKDPLDLPGTRVLWLTAGKAPVGTPEDVAAIMGQGQQPGGPPPEGGDGQLPPGDQPPELPPGDGEQPPAEIPESDDPIGDALLGATETKALPKGDDPLAGQRAAQAAVVDAHVAALEDEIAALFHRQERVILARLTGAKARKHTRHWVPKEGTTSVLAAGRELKALDPEYITDRKRWIDEVVSAITAIVRAAFGASGQFMYGNLGGEGEFDAGKDGNAAIAQTVRVIAEGFDARAGRLGDIIRDADEAGNDIEQIADKVRAAFQSTDTWANVTSRQVVGAMNAAQQIAAVQVGAVRKRWLATDDERTRMSHRDAEGQVVDIDAKFDVGEGELMFPGDPTGPIGEWINCRCTMLFQTPERDFDAELDADLADLDAYEAESKGLVGRASSAVGRFLTPNVRFDPDAHPRDHRGRFVDTPDVVLASGDRGVAVGTAADGSIIVAKPTGAVVNVDPGKVSDPPKPAKPRLVLPDTTFRPLTGGLVSANEAAVETVVGWQNVPKEVGTIVVDGPDRYQLRRVDGLVDPAWTRMSDGHVMPSELGYDDTADIQIIRAANVSERLTDRGALSEAVRLREAVIPFANATDGDQQTMRGVIETQLADRSTDELAQLVEGMGETPAGTRARMIDQIATRLTVADNTDYRGNHQPPSPSEDVGARMSDIEQVMPDFYSRPELYRTGAPGGEDAAMDAESTAAILPTQGNPDALVTVYRAVPPGVDTINPGDWVTPSRMYAERHGMHETDPAQDWPVLSAEVRAGDLWTHGDSQHEFGWWPTAAPADRVRALMPFRITGPTYDRGITDDVNRALNAHSKGDTEQFDYWMRSAERRAEGKPVPTFDGPYETEQLTNLDRAIGRIFGEDPVAENIVSLRRAKTTRESYAVEQGGTVLGYVEPARGADGAPMGWQALDPQTRGNVGEPQPSKDDAAALLRPLVSENTVEPTLDMRYDDSSNIVATVPVADYEGTGAPDLDPKNPDRAVVGWLRWGLDSDGETERVQGITVDENYRRRGLATRMWVAARQRQSNLQHDTSLTEDGRAWVDSLVSENVAESPVKSKGNERLKPGDRVSFVDLVNGERTGTVLDMAPVAGPGHKGSWWVIPDEQREGEPWALAVAGNGAGSNRAARGVDTNRLFHDPDGMTGRLSRAGAGSATYPTRYDGRELSARDITVIDRIRNDLPLDKFSQSDLDAMARQGLIERRGGVGDWVVVDKPRSTRERMREVLDRRGNVRGSLYNDLYGALQYADPNDPDTAAVEAALDTVKPAPYDPVTGQRWSDSGKVRDAVEAALLSTASPRDQISALLDAHEAGRLDPSAGLVTRLRRLLDTLPADRDTEAVRDVLRAWDSGTALGGITAAVRSALRRDDLVSANVVPYDPGYRETFPNVWERVPAEGASIHIAWPKTDGDFTWTVSANGKTDTGTAATLPEAQQAADAAYVGLSASGPGSQPDVRVEAMPKDMQYTHRLSSFGEPFRVAAYDASAGPGKGYFTEDGLVGFVDAYREPDGTVNIGYVATRPGYERQGIASELMDRAVEGAPAVDVGEIMHNGAGAIVQRWLDEGRQVRWRGPLVWPPVSENVPAEVFDTPSVKDAPAVTPDPVGGGMVSENIFGPTDEPWERGDTPYFNTEAVGRTVNERLTNCYELSAQATLMGAPDGSKLVYGTIQGDDQPPLGHAWVELPNGDVWEPISHKVMGADEYTLTFGAIPHRKYDQTEARINLLREQHYGPWYDTDERGNPVEGAPTAEERADARAAAAQRIADSIAPIRATLGEPRPAFTGENVVMVDRVAFNPADHQIDAQGNFDEPPLVRNGDTTGIAVSVNNDGTVNVLTSEGESTVPVADLVEVTEAGYRTDLLAPNEPDRWTSPENIAFWLRASESNVANGASFPTAVEYGSEYVLRLEPGGYVSAWAKPAAGNLDPHWRRVGIMSWNTVSGEILDIRVDEEHRRQGIATAMLGFARQAEPHIHHSTNLTSDGEAWSLVTPNVAEVNGPTYKWHGELVMVPQPVADRGSVAIEDWIVANIDEPLVSENVAGHPQVAALARIAGGYDLTDPEDRANFRGAVRDHWKDMTVAAAQDTARALGVAAPAQSRDEVTRQIADAWINRPDIVSENLAEGEQLSSRLGEAVTLKPGDRFQTFLGPAVMREGGRYDVTVNVNGTERVARVTPPAEGERYGKMQWLDNWVELKTPRPDQIEGYSSPAQLDQFRIYTAPDGRAYLLQDGWFGVVGAKPLTSADSPITREFAARDNNTPLIGTLSWFGGNIDRNPDGTIDDRSNINGGRIHKVFVKPAHRRNGVATAMLQFARERHPDMQIRHSDALSEDGAAFADATPVVAANIAEPVSTRTVAGVTVDTYPPETLGARQYTRDYTPVHIHGDGVDVTLYEGSNGELYESCGRCGGRGVIPHFGHVLEGVCFGCAGTGVEKNLGDTDAAIKRMKRRAKDRARREAKRQAEFAARRAEYQQWAETNADTLAALAPYAEDTGQPWTPTLDRLRAVANEASGGLTIDIDYAKGLLDEQQTHEMAHQIKQAAARHAGEVGDKVTTTGRVKVAKYVEPQNYGWSGSMFLIIEGTGDDTGITIKTFGSGRTLFDAKPGDLVTIAGTVKAHDTYEGLPQTQLTRAKVTVDEKAPDLIGERVDDPGGLRGSFGVLFTAIMEAWAQIDHDEPAGGEYETLLYLPAGKQKRDIPLRFRANPRDDLTLAANEASLERLFKDAIIAASKDRPDYTDEVGKQIRDGDLGIGVRFTEAGDIVHIDLQVKTDDGAVWSRDFTHSVMLPVGEGDATDQLFRDWAREVDLGGLSWMLPDGTTLTPEPAPTPAQPQYQGVPAQARANIPTLRELVDSGMTPADARAEWLDLYAAEKARLLAARDSHDTESRRAIAADLFREDSASDTPVAIYGLSREAMEQVRADGSPIGPGAVPEYMPGGQFGGKVITWAGPAANIPEGEMVPVRNVNVQGVVVPYGWATKRDGMPMMVGLWVTGSDGGRGEATKRFDQMQAAWRDTGIDAHVDDENLDHMQGIAWLQQVKTSAHGHGSVIATGGDGTVTFWRHPPETQTLRHEFGHNVDTHGGNTRQPREINTEAWTTAYDLDTDAFAEIAPLFRRDMPIEFHDGGIGSHPLVWEHPNNLTRPLNTDAKVNGPTAYGQTMPMEDYAESLAFYLKDRVHNHLGVVLIDPEGAPHDFRYADLYPWRARYFDGLFGNLPAPLSGLNAARLSAAVGKFGPLTEWTLNQLENELRLHGINPTGMTRDEILAALARIPKMEQFITPMEAAA